MDRNGIAPDIAARRCGAMLHCRPHVDAGMKINTETGGGLAGLVYVEARGMPVPPMGYFAIQADSRRDMRASAWTGRRECVWGVSEPSRCDAGRQDSTIPHKYSVKRPARLCIYWGKQNAANQAQKVSNCPATWPNESAWLGNEEYWILTSSGRATEGDHSRARFQRPAGPGRGDRSLESARQRSEKKISEVTADVTWRVDDGRDRRLGGEKQHRQQRHANRWVGTAVDGVQVVDVGLSGAVAAERVSFRR